MGSIFFTMASCTDKFDEWNTNQQEATEEMMTRDDLATGAFFVQMQKNVMTLEQLDVDGNGIGASKYQVIDNLTGASFAGYTGACNNWNNDQNFLYYVMDMPWKDDAFERGFIGVMAAWDKLTKKAVEKNRPQVAALAAIVKVLAMSRVTDTYGPLPYTRFGNGELFNPYDSQEAIYNSFFKDLDQSIDVLYNLYSKDPAVKVLEKYDFIYSGKVDYWIRFANSLKLRLAMRIVYADPAKAQKMANEAVAHPIGVMTKPTDVASLKHTDSFAYRHPLYVIGTGEFQDARMGATMDSYLNGYNDPRIKSHFVMAETGKYTGIRTGIPINRNEYAKSGDFSDLAVAATDEVVWMNPSESYFLRAEGAIRNWAMGGGAKELYEEGIRTSFDFLKISSADSYINDDHSLPAAYTDPVGEWFSIPDGSPLLGKVTIKWEENADFEKKLERIITQKWIAIYPDGQEAWTEFRRTHYPKVFPIMMNMSTVINTEKQVRRVPFPSTEYRDNAKNMSEAISLLGGDDTGATRLWWDKK